MKKKLKIILIAFVLVFVVMKMMRYSETHLDDKHYAAVQEKCNLDLSGSIEWKYYKGERWNLQKREYYFMQNRFLEMFKNDLEDDTCYTWCSIYVSSTLETLDELVLHPYKEEGSQIIVDQEVYYRNKHIPIHVELIKVNRFSSMDNKMCIPYCHMEFEYQDQYYRVLFHTNNDLSQTYYENETKIHQEELDVYFQFFDEILK